MSQAYYSSSIKAFLLEHTDSIKGKLDKGSTQHVQIWTIQFDSWESSIEILKKQKFERKAKKIEIKKCYLCSKYIDGEMFKHIFNF